MIDPKIPEVNTTEVASSAQQDDEEKQKGTGEVTTRQIIYALLDPGVPASSTGLAVASTIISITVFALIYISIMVFCIESHPQFYKEDNSALYVVESVCVGVFTLELALKIATVEDKKEFCKVFLNWIDFISILPYYVELFVTRIAGASYSLNSFVFLRVIRLARVFRVFKLGKYSTGLQLVIYAMRQSSEALSLLGFLLGIALVLFASLVFIAEQSEAEFNSIDGTWYYNWNGTDGLPVRSHFQSIPDSFWWALVTLATVGYGDQVPKTWFGRAVGVICMIVGVLVLAFPIILISNNFSDAVKEFNYQRSKECNAEEQSRDSPQNQTIQPARSAKVLTSEQPENDLLPRPSPFCVVAFFRYGGKIRSINFTTITGVANKEIYGFRYDPLFYISLDHNGVVRVTETVNQAVGSYLLSFDILLDSDHISQLAIASITKLASFDKKKVVKSAVHAVPLTKVNLSVQGLAPEVTLTTAEFSNPSGAIPVVLSATSKKALDAARTRLPMCVLQCSCSRTFESTTLSSDYQVTVPLFMSALRTNKFEASD
eukprot:TRINITY_DN3958_c0_g2_i1.p1 TRINITY_DN3958_c0_g2~~TRINITY_DN3958_c0_g2_i1.p1  ORF type:complete len:545 (+),score=66.67 TRINITY_DN3958_c0_g2_i1:72-1706(+)